MGNKYRQFNNPVTKLGRAATHLAPKPFNSSKCLGEVRLCGLFMCFYLVAALNSMGEGRENGRKRVVMFFPTTGRYLENDPLPHFKELIWQ